MELWYALCKDGNAMFIPAEKKLEAISLDMFFFFVIHFLTFIISIFSSVFL